MCDPVAGQTPVLCMAGDLDVATENYWRERSDDLLAEHPDFRDITVDMAGVSFLDSRGMAVLVHLHTAALGRGGSLRLRSAPPRIVKALNVAGLDQVFAVESS
jgi:stage II sporulation protein AA (anti-sigma F factor antagonist)